MDFDKFCFQVGIWFPNLETQLHILNIFLFIIFK